MKTIELNKKVTSIEVQGDKIIINLEQEYIPKDGEYFFVNTVDDNEFIAIKKKGGDVTNSYCCLDVFWAIIHLDPSHITDDKSIKELRPATEEEKGMLNKALKKEGKKWNPKTMQIEKLPKVGDFCIFWYNNKSMARCGILSEVASKGLPYLINYGGYYSNCIPFQSIEHFKEFIKG